MRILPYLGALALAVAIPQFSHAQTITNLEAERAARWPGTIPYNFEPYTQRYSIQVSSMGFFNGNPHYLRYLDYVDRADRAYKFGYKMPNDPYFYRPMQPPETVIVAPAPVPVTPGEETVEPQPWAAPAPQPVRGFGILRRR